MTNPTVERRHPIFALLTFLIITFAVGFVGTYAVNAGLSFWYVTINKPSWNPPTWVFAPVWTTLYVLMSIAAWMVWSAPQGEQPSGRRTASLVLYFSQLVLNGLWSWIFFYWHMIGAAAIEIGVMWLAILVTMILFWRIRPRAGQLMVPYLLWVTFAMALNIAIFRLNR